MQQKDSHELDSSQGNKSEYLTDNNVDKSQYLTDNNVESFLVPFYN